MNTLRLAWLLGRRSAADRGTIVLPVVAFAVVTALLLIVAGGAQAFFSWTGETAFLYQLLAVVALALLIVPLVALGGSAARLSARRRDDRLASLRLLGATPGTVTALTVIESTVLALVGALAGVVISLGAAPLVGLIPFRGEPLGATVFLHPLLVAVVVLAVGALAALSAVIGLRGVILSPLGVRTRQTAPRMHWMRVVIGLGVVAVTFMAMSVLQLASGFGVVLTIMAVGFGGTVAVLNLVGPWVLRLVASGQAKRAKTPTRLLAARSILESPKAAWRQVSGVAMTSFMAVFAGVGVALLGVAADSGKADAQSLQIFADIRTGVIITVVASFLMVACSVGVNQASAVLDRRAIYVSLDRLGMPVETMNAARSRAVLSPLRITTIGSAVTAAVVIFPLTGLSLLVAPASLLMIAGCLAAGIFLVWLGLRATRPVLARVLADPSPSL
ncbi:permease [Leifsonia sp. Root227]|uniref:FtsX-like permease family protein n=1 Tax=Leifsonia sp. Root227 TaxID=1736496 RepID=UPI0006F1DC32|nr:FtsX-like permease family protein [Leifsonia sp. Root227]KRC47179.1 permease [Leifsonia sp. Root227]